jgi:hypothetical protein
MAKLPGWDTAYNALDANLKTIFDYITAKVDNSTEITSSNIYYAKESVRASVYLTTDSIKATLNALYNFVSYKFYQVSNEIADVDANISNSINNYVMPALWTIQGAIQEMYGDISNQINLISDDVHDQLLDTEMTISQMVGTYFLAFDRLLNKAIANQSQVIQSYFYDIPYNLFTYFWNMFMTPEIKPKEPPISTEM